MNTHDSTLLLGIDIGTTTLSFVLLAPVTRAAIRRVTIPNDSGIPSADGQHMQDAARIADRVLDTVRSLLSDHPHVAAIGITGQMHGVLCLDADGQPVSPLYTWQDQRADSGVCAEIAQKTGHRIYPGYGHATLYALKLHGGLPESVRQYCTIMDYIAMRLTGRKSPLMHSSNAASLGLWDLRAGRWDEAALRALDLAPLSAPEATGESRIAGMHAGIPVCVAIGDNQASFFGSVADESGSLLLNVGTGSQLSLVCASPDAIGGEIRPYLAGQYLLCRSALCGGRAYAMLERFFAAFAAQAGHSGSQYETLNALAEKAYRDGKKLLVSTTFCGTRDDPSLRGSIERIGEENFTPGALALGVLQGMVDELYAGFDPARHPGVRRLVASGNAVRRNPVLRALLADTFAMPLSLTAQQEEAALGAALFGGVCAGLLTCEQAKDAITLESE